MQWKITSAPALHWIAIKQDRVLCTLCPRNCRINPNKVGFCGVRKNVEGELKTLNYGKSVPITCESIETEAVFHYAPGEAILSLGNIGCMMKCDFCQNWSTSQSRLVADHNVIYTTPEEVVSYAIKHNIRVLSWTYNDPVVWHEFVMDTARLAKSKGLKNVYKSAFYINPAAIDDLLEVMDVFSISIKSLNPIMYQQTTKGKMQPVLDGIIQVHQAIKNGAKVHLELSNLCVTGRNDNLIESMAVANWMLENLDDQVPLHYVRFHPDYLYTQVERTDPQFLEEARTAAINAGLKYVYVGNVHGTPSSNTYCPSCQTVLIERYGLSATSYLKQGCCPSCDLAIPISMPWGDAQQTNESIIIPQTFESVAHLFRGAIRSCHIEKTGDETLYYQFETAQGQSVGAIQKISCDRFMLSSPSEDAQQVRFFFKQGQTPRSFEVYDRAHFPVVDAHRTFTCSEDVPPIFDNQKIR